MCSRGLWKCRVAAIGVLALGTRAACLMVFCQLGDGRSIIGIFALYERMDLFEHRQVRSEDSCRFKMSSFKR